MSRPSTGYSNSNYGQEPTNRYEDDRPSGSSLGGSRERRPGGYGGFANDTLSVPTDGGRLTPLQRRASDTNTNGSYSRSRSDREDTDWDNSSRSRERDKQKSRGFGNGPGGRQIEGKQSR